MANEKITAAIQERLGEIENEIQELNAEETRLRAILGTAIAAVPGKKGKGMSPEMREKMRRRMKKMWKQKKAAKAAEAAKNNPLGSTGSNPEKSGDDLEEGLDPELAKVLHDVEEEEAVGVGAGSGDDD